MTTIDNRREYLAKRNACGEARGTASAQDCASRLADICQAYGLDYLSTGQRHTGQGEYRVTGLDSYTGKPSYQWYPDRAVGVGTKPCKPVNTRISAGLAPITYRYKASKQSRDKIQRQARGMSRPSLPWRTWCTLADRDAYIELYQELEDLRGRYSRAVYHASIRPLQHRLQKRILSFQT